MGILYNESPCPLYEDFDFNDFDNIDEFWIKYEGTFSDDNKEGKGTLFLTNGENFMGNFKNDAINGNGVYYGKDGRIIIEGFWINNKLISNN